jgi:hypothetical protein
VAAYHILKDEGDYRDLEADDFDPRRRERTVSQPVGRLQRLGYKVVLATIECEAASSRWSPEEFVDAGANRQEAAWEYRCVLSLSWFY